MIKGELKTIVFDFDGVLTVGGEELKHRAWEILLLPITKKFQTVLRVNRERFARGEIQGARYGILRETFKQLGMVGGGEKELELLVNTYAEAYNILVQGLLSLTGLVNGVVSVLKKLSNHYPLYINSATPELAVQESAARLGIAPYFKAIYGEPRNKMENLERVIKAENIPPAGVIFVGDGDKDWQAAQKFGCRFVGVANNWNGWKSTTFPLIESVTRLPDFLRMNI